MFLHIYVHFHVFLHICICCHEFAFFCMRFHNCTYSHTIANIAICAFIDFHMQKNVSECVFAKLHV